MIGKAALVRLKNNDTYVGIIMELNSKEVHIHTWNQEKNKLSDTIKVMNREDCLTIDMPIEGVSNENYIGNILRRAEALREEAEKLQRANVIANSAPRIQRPS